jgi:hypothetical protein
MLIIKHKYSLFCPQLKCPSTLEFESIETLRFYLAKKRDD